MSIITINNNYAQTIKQQIVKFTQEIDNNEIKCLYIYTSPYIVNIARVIGDYFVKNNIIVHILTKLIFDEHVTLVNSDKSVKLFFIGFETFFGACRDKLLILNRRSYILYQLEQINTDVKYANNILDEMPKFINNALFVIDYNIINFAKLPDNINKIHIDLPICQSVYLDDKKTIDILFYGSINNYRKMIIHQLQKHFNVVVLKSTFQEELKDYIKKSKLILNIHFYDDSILETCRINEAINYGCKIISEYPEGYLDGIYQKYDDLITYVDFLELDLAINIIKTELSKYNVASIDKNRLTENINRINEPLALFSSYIAHPHIFNKYIYNQSSPNKPITYEYEYINTQYYSINDELLKFQSEHSDIITALESDDIFFNDELDKLQEIINIIIEKNNVIKTIIPDDGIDTVGIAHLHCYDLSRFDEFFQNYITNIVAVLKFMIIITYCVESDETLKLQSVKNKYILLKIPNRGMDIGAKICAIDFLCKNNIKYKHLLFLHSKADVAKREKYFSIIDDNNIRLTQLKLDENYDGIFPNIQINGDWNTGEFIINKAYTYDLLNYMNINDKLPLFIEGNCMILSKRVVDKIFTNNLMLFYNLLNYDNSFDVNWVKWYYKKHHYTTSEMYNEYNKNNLYGNDLAHAFTNKIFNNYLTVNPVDGYKLADGMIEHAFERLYLSVIKSFNKGKYFVI